MVNNNYNLKQLIHLIKENKDFEANLILDEGCTVTTDDPKPLIKVLNYIINYLNQLTNHPLEISLDLRETDSLLSIMGYSDKTTLPEMSSQIDDVLKTYNAEKNVIHESGKYVQVKLSFKR